MQRSEAAPDFAPAARALHPGYESLPLSRNAADRTVDGAPWRVVTSARILDQHRPIRARVDALYSIGQVIRALLDRVARTGAVASVASVASSRVRVPTECNPKRGA